MQESSKAVQPACPGQIISHPRIRDQPHEDFNCRDPLETSIAHPDMDFLDEDIVDATFALITTPSTSIPYHVRPPNVLETSPTWAPKLQPFIVSPPKLELKPFPSSLKYAFLNNGETLLVFVLSSKLSSCENEKLLDVLREHKAVIRWIIADIERISASVCTHNIYMEEDSKPTRDAQRRLNPPMMEVVKNKVTNLLDRVDTPSPILSGFLRFGRVGDEL